MKLAVWLIYQGQLHEDVWGREGIAPAFLTEALGGSEWSASRPSHFTRKERALVPIGDVVLATELG
jgi:hypothetical protein